MAALTRNRCPSELTPSISYTTDSKYILPSILPQYSKTIKDYSIFDKDTQKWFETVKNGVLSSLSGNLTAEHGFYYFNSKLKLFIDLYGYRFTKTDHAVLLGEFFKKLDCLEDAVKNLRFLSQILSTINLLMKVPKRLVNITDISLPIIPLLNLHDYFEHSNEIRMSMSSKEVDDSILTPIIQVLNRIGHFQELTAADKMKDYLKRKMQLACNAFGESGFSNLSKKHSSLPDISNPYTIFAQFFPMDQPKQLISEKNPPNSSKFLDITDELLKNFPVNSFTAESEQRVYQAIEFTDYLRHKPETRIALLKYVFSTLLRRLKIKNKSAKSNLRIKYHVINDMSEDEVGTYAEVISYLLGTKNADPVSDTHDNEGFTILKQFFKTLKNFYYYTNCSYPVLFTLLSKLTRQIYNEHEIFLYKDYDQIKYDEENWIKHKFVITKGDMAVLIDIVLPLIEFGLFSKQLDLLKSTVKTCSLIDKPKTLGFIIKHLLYHLDASSSLQESTSVMQPMISYFTELIPAFKDFEIIEIIDDGTTFLMPVPELFSNLILKFLDHIDYVNDNNKSVAILTCLNTIFEIFNADILNSGELIAFVERLLEVLITLENYVISNISMKDDPATRTVTANTAALKFRELFVQILQTADLDLVVKMHDVFTKFIVSKDFQSDVPLYIPFGYACERLCTSEVSLANLSRQYILLTSSVLEKTMNELNSSPPTSTEFSKSLKIKLNLLSHLAQVARTLIAYKSEQQAELTRVINELIALYGDHRLLLHANTYPTVFSLLMQVTFNLLNTESITTITDQDHTEEKKIYVHSGLDYAKMKCRLNHGFSTVQTSKRIIWRYDDLYDEVILPSVLEKIVYPLENVLKYSTDPEDLKRALSCFGILNNGITRIISYDNSFNAECFQSTNTNLYFKSGNRKIISGWKNRFESLIQEAYDRILKSSIEKQTTIFKQINSCFYSITGISGIDSGLKNYVAKAVKLASKHDHDFGYTNPKNCCQLNSILTLLPDLMPSFSQMEVQSTGGGIKNCWLPGPAFGAPDSRPQFHAFFFATFKMSLTRTRRTALSVNKVEKSLCLPEPWHNNFNITII